MSKKTGNLVPATLPTLPIEVIQNIEKKSKDIKHLYKINYAFRQRKRMEEVEKVQKMNVDESSRTGDIKGLESWKEIGVKKEYTKKSMDEAKNDSVIEWWINSKKEIKYSDSTLESLTDRKSIKLLEKLGIIAEKQELKSQEGCEREIYVMDQASENGDIEMLDWWLKNYEIYYEKIPLSHKAISQGIKHEYLNVLNWFVEIQEQLNQEYNEDLDPDIKKKLKIPGFLIEEAYVREKFNIVMWFKKNKINICWDYNMAAYRFFNIFQIATYFGHIDVLIWAFQNQEYDNGYFSFQQGVNYMDVASHKGCIEALNWWISNFNQEIQNGKFYSRKALCIASENGLVNVLEWWLEQIKKNIIKKIPEKYQEDQVYKGYKEMDLACIHGEIDILEFWEKNYKSFFKDPPFTYRSISIAIEKKNEIVLQWWENSKLEFQYTEISTDIQRHYIGGNIQKDYDIQIQKQNQAIQWWEKHKKNIQLQ